MDDLKESVAADILTKSNVKKSQRKKQQRPVQRVPPLQRFPPMQSQQVPQHDNNEPPSGPAEQSSEPQSAKMLIFLQSGEQRLITFTLPRESCTLQEVLEQVKVPFSEDTHIQCMQNTSSEIDYFVAVGCTSRIEDLLENHPMLVGEMSNRSSSNVPLQSQSSETRSGPKKSSCPESYGSSDALSHSSMQDLVATLTCRTIKIGSYKYTPKEKVTISSKGIKIVAPSLKDKTRDVVLQIQLKEVVRILAHFSKGVPVIFLYAMNKCGGYIRKALDMVDDQGPYYNPMSKVDQHKRIILLPDYISDEAKMAFKVLFSKIMDELNARETNEILIRTCTKESHSVT